MTVTDEVERDGRERTHLLTLQQRGGDRFSSFSSSNDGAVDCGSGRDAGEEEPCSGISIATRFIVVLSPYLLLI